MLWTAWTVGCCNASKEVGLEVNTEKLSVYLYLVTRLQNSM
jgi:hypothetical protein